MMHFNGHLTGAAEVFYLVVRGILRPVILQTNNLKGSMELLKYT
jgi:hypothetical protein